MFGTWEIVTITAFLALFVAIAGFVSRNLGLMLLGSALMLVTGLASFVEPSIVNGEYTTTTFDYGVYEYNQTEYGNTSYYDLNGTFQGSDLTNVTRNIAVPIVNMQAANMTAQYLEYRNIFSMSWAVILTIFGCLGIFIAITTKDNY